MSKNAKATATLAEIIDRIDSDRHADAEWYDVMGIEIPGLADAMANDDLDAASEIEAAYIREHESDMYEVRWPDYAIAPRYDGDASYVLVDTPIIHYTEIRTATLEELNAALGSDGYHDDIYAARDAVARLINAKQPLTLHDYRTGDAIRPATDDEAGESINAGDEGVITVDSQRCYVA